MFFVVLFLGGMRRSISLPVYSIGLRAENAGTFRVEVPVRALPALSDLPTTFDDDVD